MIKSRKTLTYKGMTHSWFTLNGSIYPGSDSYLPVSAYESQTTNSVGTPYQRKRQNPRFKDTDMGSDFTTQKSLVFQPQEIQANSGSGSSIRYFYEGPFYAHTPISAPGYAPVQSKSQMDAYGTSSIARALPTNPLSGMGQFLGELRDLPKLPLIQFMKRKANSFRELSRISGSEYLNVVFGWVPFVKDLVQLTEVLAKADEAIKQYDRDSGRTVRRRLVLHQASDTVITLMGTSYGYPPQPGPMYTSPGKLTKTVTTTTRIWFSGAFTYHVSSGSTPASIEKDKRGGNLTSFIPERSDPKLVRRRAMQIRSKLYGLRLDPYLLYQLTPWSWAIDWVTNLGSVVKNLTAFQNDGLVLRYGYVMHQTRITTMYSLDGVRFKSGGSSSFRDVYVQVTKMRTKATPFGFGLNPAAFSPRQLAIIAALGMSRGPR